MRPSRITLRALAVAAVWLCGTAATTSPAQAADPLQIVHREKVVAGPYELTVGFSRWPLKEGRSFDLTVDPAGGIAGKSGTISVITPSGKAAETQGYAYDEVSLSRHPRQRQSWGMDVVSFLGTGSGGRWSLEFAVDGPQGKGQGRLAALPFEPLPGPPQTLSWLMSTIPTLLIGLTIGLGWRRLRPSRRPGAWSLTAPAEPAT
jgi:hypothetical protein